MKFDLANKYKCIRLKLYLWVIPNPYRINNSIFLELTDAEAEHLKLSYGLNLTEIHCVNDRFVIVSRSAPHSDDFKKIKEILKYF